MRQMRATYSAALILEESECNNNKEYKIERMDNFITATSDRKWEQTKRRLASYQLFKIHNSNWQKYASSNFWQRKSFLKSRSCDEN